MTRHVSEEREKLAAKLRVTTEQMAHRCSVDQVLWNMHSNACLEAADLLLSTSSAERGMREALESIRYHSENQDMNHLTFRIKARECADAAIEKATKP